MNDDRLIIPAAPGTRILLMIAHDDEREVEDHLVPVVAWEIDPREHHLTPISTIGIGDNVWLLAGMHRGHFYTGHWGSDLVYTRETARELAKSEMGKRIEGRRAEQGFALKCIARADGVPGEFAGQYLARCEIDGHDGAGLFEWTADPEMAHRFATTTEAWECWRRQSTTHPTRRDSLPNRPMTAYTIQITPWGANDD
jgi:hypothetical protein